MKAYVVLRRGEAVDAPALAAWVSQSLAAFKVPSRWEIRREPLPRNAAGKVLKHVLTGQEPSPFIAE